MKLLALLLVEEVLVFDNVVAQRGQDLALDIENPLFVLYQCVPEHAVVDARTVADRTPRMLAVPLQDQLGVHQHVVHMGVELPKEHRIAQYLAELHDVRSHRGEIVDGHLDLGHESRREDPLQGFRLDAGHVNPVLLAAVGKAILGERFVALREVVHPVAGEHDLDRACDDRFRVTHAAIDTRFRPDRFERYSALSARSTNVLLDRSRISSYWAIPNETVTEIAVSL